MPGKSQGSGAPGNSGQAREKATFTARIENISDTEIWPSAPPIPKAAGGAALVSPGLYAVYRGGNPIWKRQQEAPEGVEAVAEAGEPLGTPENDSLLPELQDDPKVYDAGTWLPEDTVEDPLDPFGAPPIAPGGFFEFEFEAIRGTKLMTIEMLTPSNDVFMAPSSGIQLFKDGPISGDITDEYELWDAGTEPNKDPASGHPTTAPRQVIEFQNPDLGGDEGGVIRNIDKVDDGYFWPDPTDVIEFTLTPQ